MLSPCGMWQACRGCAKENGHPVQVANMIRHQLDNFKEVGVLTLHDGPAVICILELPQLRSLARGTHAEEAHMC